MNYGLYVASSGVLSGMHRLDVASNNLANVATVGFKADFAGVMQRDAARIEDGLLHVDSNRMLEALGAGVLQTRTRTAFEQGPLQDTGNPLDVAILGEGFFTLDSGEGDEAERVRYTRDGRFTLDARATLVSATNALPVLDDAGRAITLDPTQPARISSAGEVMQGGRPVARLRLAAPIDDGALVKLGDNIYGVEAGRNGATRPAAGEMRSGAVEGSSVDPIRAMLAVNKAAGDIRTNTKMIELHNELMNRAINTFGRIG